MELKLPLLPLSLPHFLQTCRIRFQGWGNKAPQAGGLNKRRLFSQSGGWKSEIKVWAGLFPSDGREEEHVASILSPSFWSFPGSRLGSLACGRITLVSAFVFTQHSPCMGLCQSLPFLVRTPVVWDQRGPPYSCRTSSQLMTSAMVLSSNEAPFQGTGARTSTCELEVESRMQLITPAVSLALC